MVYLLHGYPFHTTPHPNVPPSTQTHNAYECACELLNTGRSLLPLCSFSSTEFTDSQSFSLDNPTAGYVDCLSFDIQTTQREAKKIKANCRQAIQKIKLHERPYPSEHTNTILPPIPVHPI